MAETKLGDLYFDVVLKDQTKAGIDAIKKQVEDTLKAGEGTKTFNAAEKAQEAYNAALEKSHILQEQLIRDAIKLQEENKRTEKMMREAARPALDPSVHELDSTSVTAMKQKVKELLEQYNALSKAEREGSKGDSILLDVGELQKELSLVEQITKSQKRANDLLAQKKNLETANGHEENNIRLQQDIALMRQLIQLDERKRQLEAAPNGNHEHNDATRAIRLQESIKAAEELIRVEYQLDQIKKPNSKLNQINENKAKIAAEQAYLDIKNKELQLQRQLDAERQFGARNAVAQANLDVERRKNMLIAENIRLARERDSFDSKIAKTNRQRKLELQLLQQKAQLEQKLRSLTGTDKYSKMAQDSVKLQTEVSLMQRKLQLQAKIAFYQSAEGKELRKLEEKWRKLQGHVEGTTGAMKSQGKIMQSLSNMVRNYVGAWGAVSLIKSLYRIRGEFEMQYVALKSIMQSATQATEMYGKLQGLAIESPFKFQDLLGFSKQLSAFQIPNRELFDTTKRLADLSAGLGVDMSRIILAYGQVRSAVVLRGQELRQFTEAGIPMVQALADKFTELEGRVVSTGEVFDKISKRQVSFQMVKEIIEDLTDEGGRFYNHQLKQSETLYGKMQKLGDAWQIMMNNIGQSKEGFLKWTLDSILSLVQNWRTLERLIVDGAVFYGIRRIVMMSVTWDKTMKSVSASFNALGGWKGMGIMAAVTLIYDLFQGIADASAEANEFSASFQESMSETSKEIEAATKRFKVYSDQLKEIHKTEREIAKANSAEDRSALADKLAKQRAAMLMSETEAERVWKELEEAMWKMPNAEANMANILAIDDLNERVQAALNLADALKQVSDILANMQDLAFVTQDTPIYGMFGEGLMSDLKDYRDYFKSAQEAFEQYKLADPGTPGYEDGKSYYESKVRQALNAYAEVENEIRKSVDQSLIPILDEVANRVWANNEQKQAAMNATVKAWVDAVKRRLAPEMSGEIGAIFEQGVRDYLEKGGFSIMQGIDLDESEYVLNRFFQIAKKVAADSGDDINDIVQGKGKMTLQELGEKIKASGLDDTDMLYRYYVRLCDNLGNLSPQITVRAGIQADSELQKYFKLFGLDISDTPHDETRGETVKRNKSDIDQINEDIQLLEGSNRALQKEIKQQGKNVELSKQIDANNAQIAKLRAEKKSKQDKLAAFDITYSGKEDKKALAAARRHEKEVESAEKKRIKAIQHRRELVEKALAEYDKLKKVMGEEKALDYLINNFDEFNSKDLQDKEGNNLLRKWAKDRVGMYRHFATEIGKSSEEAKEAVKKEDEKVFKAVVDAKMEMLQKAVDQIKARISMSAEKWKLYDSIFEATGDEAMASYLSFGGNKLFSGMAEQLQDELKSALAHEGSRITIDDILGWNDADLKNSTLPDHIKEIAKSWKDAMKSENTSVIQRTAKMVQEQYTLEQKIKAQEEKNKKELKDFLRSKGIYMEPGDEARSKLSDVDKKIYDMYVESHKKAVDDIKDSGVELTDWWKELFEETGKKGYANMVRRFKQADAIFKSYKFNGKEYETLMTDKNGKKLQNLSVKQYKKFSKNIINENNKILESNPFEKFLDSINELSSSKYKKEALEYFATALNDIVKSTQPLTESLTEMFESIGKGDLAREFGSTVKLVETFVSAAEGLAKGFGGDFTGWIQAASAGFGIISQIFNINDADIESRLKIIQIRIGKYRAEIDALSKSLERSLRYNRAVYSNISYNKDKDLYEAWQWKTAAAYQTQLTLLQKQRAEVQDSLTWAMVAKKKDASYINDLQSQLIELDDTIRYFAEDTLKDVMGVDLKGWADQLAEAIVGAFAEGEDAAKAFDMTVANIVKSMITSMSSLYVLRPMMEDLRCYLFGEDGTGGVFGGGVTPFELTEDEIAGLIPFLKNLDKGMADSKKLYDAIDQAYYQYFGKHIADAVNDATGSLGKGIQAVTEDTANLLASYVNAIRADVSMIRLMEEQMCDAANNPIAQAQITALNSIVENTRRNAEAAESINSALNSVITVGASGNKIRV